MKYYRKVEHDVDSKGEVVPKHEINITGLDYTAYTSMFYFDNEMVEYFNINKSVKGYKGRVYADYIWFDFDIKEKQTLDEVRNEVCFFLRNLLNNYGVSMKHSVKYFSGGKGFHIGIPAKLVGGISPSNRLPDHVKNFVLKLTENIKSIDTGIYNHTRLFRIPNSKHNTSGYYKVGVYTNEFFDFDDIREILNYAKEPRLDYTPEYRANELYQSETLTKLWNECRPENEKVDFSNRKKGVGFEPPKEGERNSTLFKQACSLFDRSNLDQDSIYDIIWSINQSSGNPVDDRELKTIFASAKSKTSGNKKFVPEVEKKQEDISVMTLSEAFSGYIQSVLKPKSNLTLGFQKFDRVIKNKLSGKLVGVIGKGGSKKSIFAQHFLAVNTMKRNARGIYSTMEMSANQLTERLVNTVFDPDDNMSASEVIEAMANNHNSRDDFNELMKKAQEVIQNQIKDNILITQNSSMTTEKYRKIIRDTKERGLSIDFLVVDGLSMMEDDGIGEFKSVSFHSKELKELANEEDICVILICHVTKDVSSEKRNLTDEIRGSGKILDNCDMFISASLLLDVTKETEGEPEYRNDLGCLRIFDKRGTGMISTVIYSFDPLTLKMGETDYELNMFETTKEKKKQF